MRRHRDEGVSGGSGVRGSRLHGTAILAAAVAVSLSAGCALEVGQARQPAATDPATRPDAPLPTGRWLEGGFDQVSQNVGSLPVNLVLSPDGKYAVTTGAGIRESLWSLATSDGHGVSHLNYPADKLLNPHNGLYYGLAFGPDGTLYAAQGAARGIAVLQLGDDGQLKPGHDIATGPDTFPAGLALDGRGILYVTDNDPPSPRAANPPKAGAATRPGDPASASRPAYFGDPAGVETFDAKTGRRLGRFDFESEAGTSTFPLAVAALPDGRKVYVASQRDAAVYVLNATDPAALKQSAVLSTGSHPDALLLNKSGSRLYVANAHSDTISVVDTAADRIIATVLLRPEVAKDLAGATPTGLALSPDEKTLYASLGDMNAVAVIALASPGPETAPRLLGYVPAGWYPTALAATPDGRRLLIANAKGNAARVPHDAAPNGSLGTPLNLFEGTVTTVAVPAEKDLADLTRRVLENARLTPHFLNGDNPLKDISLASDRPKKIRHVIYVVKENRTYDQVLGDMPRGNGDPNRCIFGREVTPNLHALAERFVLLDNFYDSGEVSGDGWTWSTQAQANEYTQKTVPYHYSNRGRSYDWEGQTNDYPAGGFPATGPDGKPLSNDPRFRNGARPIPDVTESPGGHLWDLARKAGLSYRNYGFFVGPGVNNRDGVVIPDNWPSAAGLLPPGHDLDGVTDIDFRQFDLDYADSDAPRAYAEKAKDDHFLRRRRTYGKHEAASRFAEWNTEFQEMLKKDPAGGAVPALMTIRFCVDHTSGASAGKPTPRSMVADNDYSVGQLVEAVSRSPVWDSTAIFVIEDDAQNGPDHVDAHRSTCYVISPWVRKGSVDHTFQNTVSVIRTMELLLGLGPMCQYDAASGAILDWDEAPSNGSAYEAVMPDPKWIGQFTAAPAKPPRADSGRGEGGAGDRDAAAMAGLVEESATMDFTHADRAPADALNRIIWKTVRGPESEMPPTPHRPVPVVAHAKSDAGPAGARRKGGDDDDD